MLENLTSKFTTLIRSFADKYKLSESELDVIIKKIRKILLDSDVSLSSVKIITANIKTKLIGLEINKKISPGQLIIKSIYDEFTTIIGGINQSNFKFDVNNLNVILFIGLQGVGKTTNILKFANWLKKKYKKKILLSSCDIHRPAAIEQLEFSCKSNNMDFFINKYKNIHDILQNALVYSKENNYDFLLVDSAGRLHLDSNMTDELRNINKILNPSYTFLVVDGMYGQDAVNSSLGFINNLPITGFVITKMDSDTKGGIILSLTHLTKKPVFFIGHGEKLNDFDVFHPDRLASRILGMGDLSSLLEEVKENFELKDNVQNINNINLISFKEQLNTLLKLGGFKKIIEKLPSYDLGEIRNDKINDDMFKKMLVIIDSMTIKEKKYPNIINHSRKKRISSGSGCSLQDINRLLKYFEKFSRFLNKDVSNSAVLNKFNNIKKNI